MNKHLILGVDGVLIRDKKLLKHLNANSVNYVAQKLPCCNNPRLTHDSLKLAVGHVGYGLNKILDVDIFDYEGKVYDQPLIDHLQEVLSKPSFQEEAERIHKLSEDGWNVTLFTNAPKVWATPVALSIGDNVAVKCPGHYKPQAKAFADFSHNQVKIFVDDYIKNLETVRWSKNWTPVYYGTEQHGWCPSVHSVKDIYNFVRKYEEKNFLIF